MTPDLLKQVPIWKGTRFVRGRMYFDLDHPERGSFVADGDEAPISDHTYACRDEVTENAWAQLVTWRQPISADQGEAIQRRTQEVGVGRERSAAGDARPLPPT
ncbi:MAG: hypothetical protein HY329_24810 [Chloroflexi bacterium]|nr:hypothetical protein [Chloroflexota bacterium]